MDCEKCGEPLAPVAASTNRERGMLACQNVECEDAGVFVRRSKGDGPSAMREDRRVQSSDDARRVIAEVLAAAEIDDRLRDTERVVFRALCAAATERGDLDLMAATMWLVGKTGLKRRSVWTARGRLERFGYVRTISGKTTSSTRLKYALDAQPTGRPPTCLRIADAPPTRT